MFTIAPPFWHLDQSNSTNCVTVIPEARINERSVPGANSRCRGTDKLAGLPDLTNDMASVLPVFDPSSLLKDSYGSLSGNGGQFRH